MFFLTTPHCLTSGILWSSLSSPQSYDATVLAESIFRPELDILIDQGRWWPVLVFQSAASWQSDRCLFQEENPCCFPPSAGQYWTPIMNKRNCMQGNQVNYIWPWCLVLSQQTKKLVCFYFIRIICIKYLNGKEMLPFSLGLRTDA